MEKSVSQRSELVEVAESLWRPEVTAGEKLPTPLWNALLFELLKTIKAAKLSVSPSN